MPAAFRPPVEFLGATHSLRFQSGAALQVHPSGSGVEGLVGWIRRNLLVPVPRAASFAALNEQLLEGCRRRFGDRLRGHEETIGERLVRDLAAFHDLPPAAYDACEKKAGRVSSLSLVRYRGTDYSVPIRSLAAEAV